jgi:hypothetical protein
VNDQPGRSRGTSKIVAHFSYVQCSLDQPSDDEDDEEGQWEEWQDRPNAETFHLKPVETLTTVLMIVWVLGACSKKVLVFSLCLSVFQRISML